MAASAWASGIAASGRVAFYSHDVRNVASAALARSLNVRFEFEVATFDVA
jgi:hypothetical protein